MSTTTRSRTGKSRTTAGLERDRELEALGLGLAPGLPGDEAGEFVERAGVCLARTLRSEVEVLSWSPDRGNPTSSGKGAARSSPGGPSAARSCAAGLP